MASAGHKSQIPLRINTCRRGQSNLGGVIALSVMFFPIGFFSGFIHGTMPDIESGTLFRATVITDTDIKGGRR